MVTRALNGPDCTDPKNGADCTASQNGRGLESMEPASREQGYLVRIVEMILGVPSNGDAEL